ncbi:unnamed protein product, partial [Mesorhabditis belari]|uniref:Tc1-like transposase DDE domain-containing protein n=1 Tax=Mesorhabditis belari TaxID=2138241 RepID=A0AAF3ELI5_9BILA
MQDDAPAHKAKKTQEWCRNNLPDFIRANEWPANSPDLNVMDFCVWAILEQKACTTKHANVESLKKALKKAWAEIPQTAVIKNKGAHIE